MASCHSKLSEFQHILLALLLLLSTNLHFAHSLTITELTKSDGTDGSLPAAVDSYKYNLEAGDSIVIKCDDAITRPKILTVTAPLAQIERFKDRAPISIGGGEFLLRDLEYSDTGLVECYSQEDDNQKSSIYIFVYDAQQPLFVPMEVNEAGQTQTSITPNDYVTCLPTHSEVSVTFRSNFNTRNAQFSTPKNDAGVQLLRFSNPVLPAFTCSLSYNGRSSRSEWSLGFTNTPAPLPEPVIMTNNDIKLFISGGTMNMSCVTSYRNVVEFQWTYPALSCTSQDCLSGAGRVTENDLVQIDGEVGSVLTVTNIQPSDSGDYTCNYIPFGTTSTATPKTSTFTVTESFVTATPRSGDVAGLKDGSVMLRVELTAIPKPVIVWSFNNGRIPDVDTEKYSQSILDKVEGGSEFEALLNIRKLSVDDTGVYMMTATSGGSASATSTFNLQVQVAPTGQISYTYDGSMQTKSEMSPLYVRPDNSLLLICQALMGVPAPDITWSWQKCGRDQCQVEPTAWVDLDPNVREPVAGTINSPHFVGSSTDKLRLMLAPESSGYFRCFMSNDVSNDTHQFLMVVSELPETSKGVGFEEGTQLSSKKLVEDDIFNLNCRISLFQCSAENVQINRGNTVWTKQTEGVTWNLGDNSYELGVQLNNITTALDKAIYFCSCLGGVQGAPVTLSVKTYLAASWVETKTTANTTYGEEQTFVCRATGRPLPEVTWYKDGEVIIPSDRVTISKDTFSLNVALVTEEDNGVYKCVGRTDRDPEIEAQFTVDIKKPASLTTLQIVLIVLAVLVLMILAIIITVIMVRKYCRKKYTPHTLLLPSKEMINPDIPLDEQTEALPYDIGWEFPIGNLKMGMLLGQGAFGRVLKAEAMNIEEGVASTTVAVKTVRDSHDIEQLKALISELKIMIHIGQHLNVVNLLGACTKELSKGQILVIVEYCRYGNLRSYLLKHKQNFNPSTDYIRTGTSSAVKLGQVTVDMQDDDEYLNPGGTEGLHSEEKPVTLHDIMSWCYQIARGMEYLASIDYIHRDLAARNVLLADDNIVKICDFGLAKDVYKYQEYQKQTDGPLPIKWMALESLEYKLFNVRTDLWSYGVTCWELFSLAATPYPGWDIDDTFIDKLKEGYRMELPKHCPEKVYQEIMLNCWHPDPEKRPNFAECADYFGDSLNDELKERLHNLEDPYLRTRDSRTDITIRKSQVRRRDPHDLESDYLPTPVLKPQANGASKSKAAVDYYNTTPSGSQPNKGKKSWLKEKALDEEKLPLHVSVDSPSDEDVPDMPAPAPSTWQRQSKVLAAHSPRSNGDTHSTHSVDSEYTRPPSYNYVMDKAKREDGPSGSGADVLRVNLNPNSSGSRNGSRSGSRDALNNDTSDRSYIETSC